MKNADIANKVDFVRLGKSLFKKNQINLTPWNNCRHLSHES